jgi:glycerophosphoryl diester phosphodiesterase
MLEKLSIKPFAVVGHRGAKGECAENTLPCIKHAVNLGVDIVEVDVRETKDGELIILHDEDFKRVAGVEIKPKEFTLKEIKEKIRVEGKYEVPTLKEVLDFIKGTDSGLFIEIKEPPTTEKIVSLVEEFHLVNRISLISFYPEALEKVKSLNSNLITGLIYIKPQNAIIRAKQVKAEIILPYYKVATPKAVTFAHRLKLKVVSWVINDESSFERSYNAKVDAMATDVPSWLLKKRQEILEG